jgi:hypothetical protein
MSLFKEAWEDRKYKLGDKHPGALETTKDLAVLYKAQARYEEAELLVIEALSGPCPKLGEKHPHTLESLHTLIALYEASGVPEEADKWRAILPQTESTRK